tara:strand:+ start:362 stop:1060 length:699 start_codon:yes stop_codon:yes gene_type:complete
VKLGSARLYSEDAEEEHQHEEDRDHVGNGGHGAEEGVDDGAHPRVARDESEGPEGAEREQRRRERALSDGAPAAERLERQQRGDEDEEVEEVPPRAAVGGRVWREHPKGDHLAERLGGEARGEGVVERGERVDHGARGGRVRTLSAEAALLRRRVLEERHHEADAAREDGEHHAVVKGGGAHEPLHRLAQRVVTAQQPERQVAVEEGHVALRLDVPLAATALASGTSRAPTA